MKENTQNTAKKIDLGFQPRFFNPRNDVAFKKIFSHYAELTRSFLNAILRLHGYRQIETIDDLDCIKAEKEQGRAEGFKRVTTNIPPSVSRSFVKYTP